jgi:hypothetical protein
MLAELVAHARARVPPADDDDHPLAPAKRKTPNADDTCFGDPCADYRDGSLVGLQTVV